MGRVSWLHFSSEGAKAFSDWLLRRQGSRKVLRLPGEREVLPQSGVRSADGTDLPENVWVLQQGLATMFLCFDVCYLTNVMLSHLI